jgi:hypothetical protein
LNFDIYCAVPRELGVKDLEAFLLRALLLRSSLSSISGKLNTKSTTGFGWTATPSISWLSPVFATIFIGAGFNIIFQQCINFLVDTYGIYAASAVSANTFLRSVMASGLPLAAQSMFHRLGVGPAMSILGAVATIAIPVPFVFMKYGLALRKKSSFAPVDED